MTDHHEAPPQAQAERLAELNAMRFGAEAWPLEYFRAMDDETIQSHYGIGPRTREQIRAYLNELAELSPASAPPPPAEPASADDQSGVLASEVDDDEEGRAGGALRLVLAAVVALVVVAGLIILAVQGGGGAQLRAAQGEVGVLRGALGSIHAGAGSAAVGQARRAYDAAKVLQLGDARAQLDEVERSLTTIELALRANQAGGGEAGAVAMGGDDPRLLAAKTALGEARAVLSLERPVGRVEIDAACARVLDSVSRLTPSDEVNHAEAIR